MRIALDAMGGDEAPKPIILGGIQAVLSQPELQLVLVGDRAQMESHLNIDYPKDRVEIFHCTQTIDMHDSPLEAMRKKPDNSISRCWQLLAEKKVDAIVSAGNTGAMVGGGFKARKFLPKLRRPGIATLMPTANLSSNNPSSNNPLGSAGSTSSCVLIDAGANLDPKPIHLLQYGIMGRRYAQTVLQKENPTIGLLNVGEEASKGNELARKTYELFHNSPLADSFVGNVEGRDIHRGKCDVVVTDAFVGNVILKLSEGVFEFIMKRVAEEIVAPLPSDRNQAYQALQRIVHRYDYRTFGGAPLLGIDGICIICHGSSDQRAIQNALTVAGNLVRNHLNDKIVTDLALLPDISDED